MIIVLESNVGEFAGEYRRSTSDREFMIYESLPTPIRRAIADAPYDFSVEDIKNAYRDAKDFDWDTMEYSNVSPVQFARQMVANFQVEVRKNSLTGSEVNGRYWFTRRSVPTLTRRRRRATIRAAGMIPTPRSIT